jgi:transposase
LRVILLLLRPSFGLSPSGLWRLLRRLRQHFKRLAQRQRSPDPQYPQLRQRLLDARARAARDPEHWVHLDADEASLHRHPSLTRTYAPAGAEPPKAGSGTADETRTIFGAVDTWSGQVHFRAAKSGSTSQWLAFVEQLLAAYPGRRLSVAVDNWSPHTSGEAQAFYAKHRERLERVWLPTYAPWLMAQEKIWKWMRAFVTHRHPFARIEQVLEHFWHWAADLQMAPHQVLTRIQKFVPVLEHAQ